MFALYRGVFLTPDHINLIVFQLFKERKQILLVAILTYSVNHWLDYYLFRNCSNPNNLNLIIWIVKFIIDLRIWKLFFSSKQIFISLIDSRIQKDMTKNAKVSAHHFGAIMVISDTSIHDKYIDDTCIQMESVRPIHYDCFHITELLLYLFHLLYFFVTVKFLKIWFLVPILFR